MNSNNVHEFEKYSWIMNLKLSVNLKIDSELKRKKEKKKQKRNPKNR